MQHLHKLTALLVITLTLGSCKKYLDVSVPINQVASPAAFGTDLSAGAALNSIYFALYSQGNFDGNTGIGWQSGLYTDELQNWSNNTNYLALYQDKVSSTVGGVTGTWSGLYKQLYSVNQALETLPSATGLQYQNQWLGEAYFLRGLMYFYLTNFYGDVPLVLTTDYLKNNALARSPQADVYKQIIADLQKAQSYLDNSYHTGNGTTTTTDRGRPNRMAATALLARTYLYTGDWANAEAQASTLIADNADYQLVAPATTFALTSKEVIWGIEPGTGNLYAFEVKDAPYYLIPNGKTPLGAGLFASMSDSLVKSFEPNDARFTAWVGIDSVPATGATPAAVYYYSTKYKAVGVLSAPLEIIALFRLGEQYLIRAEARAQQNNIGGALADLNAIRSRAGLPAASTPDAATTLAAIAHERRIELFLEQGHRFLDLRRTGALDPLMSVVAPTKQGVWTSYSKWWPIPVADIQNDKNLIQTPGYN